MKQILKENESICSIIGKAKTSVGGYRFSHYAVAEPVEDGVLLFHTLTRELLLLTPEEYEGAVESDALRQKWFVVPENTDEKKLVNTVRWVQKAMNREKPGITNYIIYTTTDCNARCFYCFELGRKRIPMSDKVALKTADFIIENHKGNPITINWFGGEPFYNARAIDLICQKLKNAGVSYKTRTITNGYLLNEENVKKCLELWNLKRIQISMDGTEQVYNKAKHYIYKEGNPYQIVMENIRRLLDNGITVVVRVNMDFHNIEDLNIFTEEMARRFGDSQKFYMYPHLIIDEKKAWNEYRTLEQWEQLYEAKYQLEQKMLKLGIFSGRSPRLSKNLPQVACMAENSNSIVITPEGNLGVCEHYSETELIGHLDSPQRDQSVINSFREHWEDIPECQGCFNYPMCIRLKKCPYIIECIPPERKELRRKLSAAMQNEYRLWLTNSQAEEDTPEAEEII